MDTIFSLSHFARHCSQSMHHRKTTILVHAKNSNRTSVGKFFNPFNPPFLLLSTSLCAPDGTHVRVVLNFVGTSEVMQLILVTFESSVFC